MGAVGWIVLAAAVAVVTWGVAVFNGLVQKRNRIANAFAQIDVQLKRRYDLIPNLVEVARRYLAHESATLEAVARARGAAVGAAAAARAHPADAGAVGTLALAEQALGQSMGRFLAVAENYPELKADAGMRSLSEELSSTENRIGFAPAAMLQSTQRAEEREAPRVAF